MRFRFPLQLASALIVATVQAQVPATSPPTSVAAALPTPPPTSPIPNASPRGTVPPGLAIPVAPEPPRERPRIVLPPAVGFRAVPPSAAEIDRVIPRVEVWRPGSNLPQTPKASLRKAKRLLQAAVSGDEPVTVRLRFHPLSRGKAVVVRAARGIALTPSDEVLTVPVDGQLILSIALDPRMSESHVSFTCEGLTTTLALGRTASSIVASREAADAAAVP